MDESPASSEAVNGNKNRTENRFGCPQKQSDPEGGIPSGSLEVLGVETWESAGIGLAVVGNHADLRRILVAAIHHLLVDE
jgi:hypothetical protein